MHTELNTVVTSGLFQHGLVLSVLLLKLPTDPRAAGMRTTNILCWAPFSQSPTLRGQDTNTSACLIMGRHYGSQHSHQRTKRNKIKHAEGIANCQRKRANYLPDISANTGSHCSLLKLYQAKRDHKTCSKFRSIPTWLGHSRKNILNRDVYHSCSLYRKDVQYNPVD